MKTALALAAVLLVAACGSETSGKAKDPSAAPAAGMPTAVPPAEGTVRTVALATVMDTGRPEVCLGGVAESYPPQCGGPPIIGWDWADHEGMFEKSGDVRWGEFALTGTFDGTTFTLEKAVPAALYDAAATTGPEEDLFTTPCPEPEGGWGVIDPATTTDASLEATFAAAAKLDGYATAWMDQSINPLDGQEGEVEGMNDPTRLIINVRVTGDTAVAEGKLREIWGGALCVSGGAVHTEAELLAIQDDVNDLPGMLSSGSQEDQVQVQVIHDDGSLQAWVDQQYGAGVVVVWSALAPLGR